MLGKIKGNRHSHFRMQNTSKALENRLPVSYKVEHILSYQGKHMTKHSTPRNLPTWVKTYIDTNTCLSMFLVLLFTTAQNLKQLKCPSTDKWINKLVHPSNELLLRMKKNQLLIHAPKWENVKCIFAQSSLTQMPRYCMITFIWNSAKSKSVRMATRSVVARGWGGGCILMSSQGIFRMMEEFHVVLWWWIHDFM